MEKVEGQSTINDLEIKLDEIKNTLRMRTETKSAIDDLEKKLDNIQISLDNSARWSRRAILISPMALGLSVALAGLSSANALTPNWGWAYFYVGLVVVALLILLYWRLSK